MAWKSLILIVFCILVVVATVITNRNDNQFEKDLEYKRNWYEELGSMLGRARCFKNKNEIFYQGLILSAVTKPLYIHEKNKLNGLYEIKIDYDIIDGRCYKGYQKREYSKSENSKEVDALFYSILESSKILGKKIYVIINQTNVVKERKIKLESAIDICFKGHEVKDVLIENVLDKLSIIDNDSEWKELCNWIVRADWPQTYCGTTRGGNPISYNKRYYLIWDKIDERRHILNEIEASDNPTEVVGLINKHFINTYETIKKSRSPSVNIGINALGLNTSAYDIIMMGAFVIVFFQFLFFFHWEHENQKQTFRFPQFSSSNDPFSSPIPKNFSEFSQRLNWGFFLSLPVLIIFFGILTRYDIHTSIENFSSLEAFIDSRSSDFISLTFDLINFLCLILSFWIVLNITTTKKHASTLKTNKLFVVSKFVFAIIIVISLCFFWLKTLYFNRLNFHNEFSWVYFSINWFSCCIFLIISYWKKGFSSIMLSVCMVTTFALIFIQPIY